MKLAALLLVALAVACQDSSAPVDPIWGKQACASCSMIISDRRYAAQVVEADGERVSFDDPGCMATWMAEHARGAGRAWVRSPSGRWIDATTARYATAEPSPMGFGFAPDDGGGAAWADVV